MQQTKFRNFRTTSYLGTSVEVAREPSKFALVVEEIEMIQDAYCVGCKHADHNLKCTRKKCKHGARLKELRSMLEKRSIVKIAEKIKSKPEKSSDKIGSITIEEFVKLREYEFTYNEIAEQAQVTIGVLKGWMKRNKQKINELLVG